MAAFALYEAVTSVVAYTSDAYVRSDLVAVAPEVTGRIVAVHVADNQTVKRGDPLIGIDPVPFQIAVAQRQAEIDAARAQAAADTDASAAALARAEADMAMAQWRLSRTEVTAPADGTVNNLTVGVGDTAVADTPLIGIIDAHAWRIIANYKQDYLRGFQPGGTAWVWLDSAPWHFHRARIAGIGRGISREETAATLLPYVAPTTDWIRLQRRFPVTLLLDEPPPGHELFMGADARVVIFP